MVELCGRSGRRRDDAFFDGKGVSRSQLDQRDPVVANCFMPENVVHVFFELERGEYGGLEQSRLACRVWSSAFEASRVAEPD